MKFDVEVLWGEGRKDYINTTEEAFRSFHNKISHGTRVAHNKHGLGTILGVNENRSLYVKFDKKQYATFFIFFDQMGRFWKRNICLSIRKRYVHSQIWPVNI